MGSAQTIIKDTRLQSFWAFSFSKDIKSDNWFKSYSDFAGSGGGVASGTVSDNRATPSSF